MSKDKQSTGGAVVVSMRKPFPKKPLIIIGILLVVLLVAGGVLAWRAKQRADDKRIAEQKTAVESSLQSETDSCSDTNVASLEDLYNQTRNTADKAGHAEQMGTCKAVQQKFGEAASWYGKAEEQYRKDNNTAKADQMKLAVESNKMLDEAISKQQNVVPGPPAEGEEGML